jgi:hypothetical protein
VEDIFKTATAAAGHEEVATVLQVKTASLRKYGKNTPSDKNTRITKTNFLSNLIIEL